MQLRKLFPLILCLAGAAAGAEIPRPSPDFAVNLNDGRQIHLSEYKGKVVVMAFILTYCQHCQFTSQILTKLQRDYGPQGLQVVASAIEDMGKMDVPDFIKKFQPPYPVGFNPREAAEDYLQHSAMFRLLMPQVVVIDRTGTIRAQFAGDDKFFEISSQERNFRGLLEPLLKERPAHTVAPGKQ